MNKSINKLTAPGRMDVIEKILKAEPFFRKQTRGTVPANFRNRRGVRKQYSALTISLVRNLAEIGLDAVNMRRNEVIARAYAFCNHDKIKQLAA